MAEIWKDVVYVTTKLQQNKNSRKYKEIQRNTKKSRIYLVMVENRKTEKRYVTSDPKKMLNNRHDKYMENKNR